MYLLVSFLEVTDANITLLAKGLVLTLITWYFDNWCKHVLSGITYRNISGMSVMRKRFLNLLVAAWMFPLCSSVFTILFALLPNAYEEMLTHVHSISM